MEFQISRKARDKFKLNDPLFQTSGSISATNTLAVREFAKKMNDQIDLSLHPEEAVQASSINAMVLLNEINHFIIDVYRQQVMPVVFEKLFDHLESMFPVIEIDDLLTKFCDAFPPTEVYLKRISANNYLASSTEGRSNRQLLLEEILILGLSNNNPALLRYSVMFDDKDFKDIDLYSHIIEISLEFFKKQPLFGPDNVDLFSMLHKPVEASPYSLPGQLDYIRNNWGFLLGNLLSRILSSLDFIKEESKAVFNGHGPSFVPDYKTIRSMIDLENERFSPDMEWMPSLVLIAKNAYVWLDQLSKKYKRSISHLDEIPDEELDFLAQAGFTGLWLIGLWQRSKASEQIKKLCGNPEALASAYSIESYRIADDLGGEDALTNLRERSWQRGIRMASDMVPNHMGIDSDWVLHHPDFFLSLDYCPFPSYSFNGPNLSPDPSIGIHLEDHYFSRTDASVVFRRTDYQTGSVKYIYHGNDGTVMPWNDTAQLNYLLPEVREAVIKIILDVARRTPIIRFDAAMTLAKKHIQRLWFPEPGSGGAIPTRSENGLSSEEFDRLLPEEFWREVVDRVAIEVPDTLLLAEAFWLMEGYFVRTLGMHRVYNSAFMNMFRDEENAKFRSLIKNTLEFDPDILKRYVNFMNNPDEETAVEQFGSGDKYFGVCSVMSTLPGLPMFGHGQIEGFTEKYGMEYRKAYLNEKVDEGLLNHHWKAIFPLLGARELYSGALNFRLYDFHSVGGTVNEDVFAYSNNFNNQRTLVFFNNKYSTTQGWITTAAPVLVKGDNKSSMLTESLEKALGISHTPDKFLIFRDSINDLMYIRDSDQIIKQGFYIALQEYEYRVFGDFYEVQEESNTHYRELCNQLGGMGVQDIYSEMRKLQIQPILDALSVLTNSNVLNALINLMGNYHTKNAEVFINQNELALSNLHKSYCNIINCQSSIESFHSELSGSIKRIGQIFRRNQLGFGSFLSISHDVSNYALSGYWNVNNISSLWLWLIIRSLNPTTGITNFYHEWFLEDFCDSLSTKGSESQDIKWFVKLLLFQNTSVENLDGSAASYLKSILQNPEMVNILGINRSNNILWFDKNKMEEWTHTQLFLFTYIIQENDPWDENKKLEELTKAYHLLQEIISNIPASEYKAEKLLDLLG